MGKGNKKTTAPDKSVYYARVGFEAPDYGVFKVGQEVPADLAIILIKRKSGYITETAPEKQKEPDTEIE